jgi:hypothetical protein
VKGLVVAIAVLDRVCVTELDCVTVCGNDVATGERDMERVGLIDIAPEAVVLWRDVCDTDRNAVDDTVCVDV